MSALLTQLQDLSKDEIIDLLTYMDEEERRSLETYIRDDALWHPMPESPQEQAYYSQADVLGFGGRAGGGKTDLGLGLGITAHRRTVILRRYFEHNKDNIDRARAIIGDYNGSSYNANTKTYRVIGPDRTRRIIEFAGCMHESDKEAQKGRPRDLYVFDELTDFTRTMFEFIKGWNRSTVPGQRCRVVTTFNPPNTAEGEWVIEYFAAWLDGKHPNPARPGELRWYVRLPGQKGEEVEVDAEELYRDALNYWRYLYVDKAGAQHELYAQSRTFIPATLDDNDYLADTAYRITLDALPEPLRSRLKLGDFVSGRTDDPYQVIPTEWIELAFQRYRDGKRPDIPMTQIGLDPSRGGDDKTCITPRYGSWIEETVKIPGSEIRRGQDVVARVLEVIEHEPLMRDEVLMAIDMTGGWGSSPYDILKADGYNVLPIVFSESTYERSRNGRLGFANVRAAIHWNAREALDPEHGDDVALAPDPEAKADLAAPKWHITTRGIAVEDKKDIKERIGRSPDVGESIMLSLYIGKYLRPQDEDSPLAKAIRSRGR